MVAILKEPRWPAMAGPGRPNGTRRIGRVARIATHLVGWPVLVKVGLLLGAALASAVQYLLAV